MTNPVIGSIPSEEMRVEMLIGADWKNIPGIIDYTESGGDAPTRDIVPAAGGVGKRAGRPRVPTITCQSYEVPTHSSWQALQEAWQNSAEHQFRFTTRETELYAAPTGTEAAIATTGVVTFSQTNGGVPSVADHGYGPGAAIIIGSTAYTIEEVAVDPNEVVMVTPPSSAVDAASFRIVIPSLRRTFRARVVAVDMWSLSAEEELQTPLVLQPLTTPAQATILTA